MNPNDEFSSSWTFHVDAQRAETRNQDVFQSRKPLITAFNECFRLAGCQWLVDSDRSRFSYMFPLGQYMYLVQERHA